MVQGQTLERPARRLLRCRHLAASLLRHKLDVYSGEGRVVRRRRQRPETGRILELHQVVVLVVVPLLFLGYWRLQPPWTHPSVPCTHKVT